MLGCKMGATPFLETSGGSGYTRLDKINVGKAVEYIVSCRNLDGGFWYIAVFCCVGALAIAGPLQHVDKGLLGWWLCEGQVKSGDLNGRPDKLPDAGLLLLVGSFKLDHDWQSPTGSIRTSLLSSSWTVGTWKMEEFQIDLMMPLMSSIYILE